MVMVIETLAHCLVHFYILISFTLVWNLKSNSAKFYEQIQMADDWINELSSFIQ